MLTKLYYGVDDIAQTGDPLVDVEISGSGAEPEPVATPAEAPKVRNVKGLATPSVRRVALEYEVSLSDISGSGKRTVMSRVPCTAKPWCLWHRGYGRTGTPLLVSLYEYRYSETAQSQTASFRLHLISPKPSRSIVDDRPVRREYFGKPCIFK